LSSTVRIPDDLYENLREIRLSLERQYQSAAPTVQDLVSVALQRFMGDWNSSEEQSQILDELLEHRRLARSKMGKRQSDSS
jgi:hypothetical protein